MSTSSKPIKTKTQKAVIINYKIIGQKYRYGLNILNLIKIPLESEYNPEIYYADDKDKAEQKFQEFSEKFDKVQLIEMRNGIEFNTLASFNISTSTSSTSS